MNIVDNELGNIIVPFKRELEITIEELDVAEIELNSMRRELKSSKAEMNELILFEDGI